MEKFIFEKIIKILKKVTLIPPLFFLIFLANAPALPIDYVAGIQKEEMVVFGAYPNPAKDNITLQVYLHRKEVLNLKMYDLQGKIVLNIKTTV